MAGSNGKFVWYELMTTDLAAARDFYTKVVGWTAQDSEMPGMEYWMFAWAGQPLAGLAVLPEKAKAMGAPPHWLGYVGVADVDATVAQASGLGATVLVPGTDIPNMGRFAILADPQGAAIAVYSSAGDEGEAPPTADMQPGHVGWHELNAGDSATAFPFYATLFGWEKKEALDMGPMGIYQMYGIGEITLGGMMTRTPEVPAPYWCYYITVPSVDAALERVTANGGTVIVGPMEVPGGSFIIVGMDPQGAVFALVGPK